MTRPFKLASLLLLTVGVVMAVAMAFAVQRADPEAWLQDLARLVRRTTGMEMVVSGPFQTTVFPWLGFRTGPITIKEPTSGDGQTPPLLSIRNLAARIEVLPLLQGRVVLDTVALAGLRLHLERDADGAANWERAMGRVDNTAAPADGTRTTNAAAPSPVAPQRDPTREQRMAHRVAVSGLLIQDAHFTFRDRASGVHLVVEDLNFKTGTIRDRRPISFELELTARQKQPALAAHLRTAGYLLADVAKRQLSLTGLAVRVDAEGAALPPAVAPARLIALAEFDHPTSTLHINDLSLTTPTLSGGGMMAIRNLAHTPDLEGRIRLAIPHLPALLGGRRATPHEDDGLSFNSRLLATPQRVELADLNGILGQLPFTGRMTLEDFSAPRIDARIMAGRIDLRPFLAGESTTTTPVPAPATRGGGENQPLLDPTALQALRVTARLGVDELLLPNQTLEEVRLSLALAEGFLTGTLQVPRWAGGTMRADLLGRVGGSATEPDVSLALGASANGLRLEQLHGPGASAAGNVDLRLRFSTRGGTLPQLIRASRLQLDGVAHRREGLLAAPADPQAPGPDTARLRATLHFPQPPENGKLTAHARVLAAVSGRKPGQAALFLLDQPLTLSTRGGEPQLGHAHLRGWLHSTLERGGIPPIAVKGEVQPRLAEGELRIPALTVALEDQAVGLEMTVSGLAEGTPRVRGNLSGKGLNPRRLAAISGTALPEGLPPEVLTALALNAGFDATAERVSLTPLVIRLDDTTIAGALTATLGSPPHLAYRVRADRLDLDRYLPPAKEDAGTVVDEPGPEEEAFGSFQEEPPLDFSWAHTVAWKGELRVDRLLARGLEIHELAIPSQLEGGRLTVGARVARLFSGSLAGELKGDFTRHTPTFSSQFHIQDVSLDQVTTTVTGHPQAGGRLELLWDLRTQGRWLRKLKRNLDGNLKVQVTDGAFRLFPAGSAPGTKPNRELPFHQLFARFLANNGTFRNDDFTIRGNTLRATGKGRVSLPLNRVDFALTAVYANSLSIPVTVKGRLQKPRIDVNMEDLVGGTVSNLLDLPGRVLQSLTR